jgi:hypothetical protein
MTLSIEILRQYASPSQICFYRENVSRKERVAARGMMPFATSPHPAVVAGWVVCEEGAEFYSARTVEAARRLRAKYGHAE